MEEYPRNKTFKTWLENMNDYNICTEVKEKINYKKQTKCSECSGTGAASGSTPQTCPTCNGSGKIKSSILFTDQLERKIDNLINKIGVSKFYLHVHPYVAAYIDKGVISLKRKWQLKYGFGVHIIPSQKLAFLQYEFYDSKGEFIDMKEEIETK